VTIYRGYALDTPDDPFRGGNLRADSDVGLVVRDGVIIEREAFGDLRTRHRGEDVVDLRDGLLLPGLVDTHVHYPQLRVIGALGMPLLEWLERCALPEEARFADVDYARTAAREFVDALVHAGTTTALVFGAHFAPAVDALFEAASSRELRIAAGLVLADRALRDDLHTDPQRAYDDGRALAQRWHGTGNARYAVTPRFSLSCSDGMLDSARALHADVPGSRLTSHLNENPDEVTQVQQLFGCETYLDSYERHGLVTERSVFAHNVHPAERELKTLAANGASVAHCPASNAMLGSGSFPLDRHRSAGVRVALGTDVGAGSGPSLFKEALQAYLVQQLRGAFGVPLTAAHLLHLATAAGAAALGMAERVGDLSVGKRFDAISLRPVTGTPLEIGLRHATSDEDALAKVFALATSADVGGVWIDGHRVDGDRVDGAASADSRQASVMRKTATI
jgi:guanine deaminase